MNLQANVVQGTPLLGASLDLEHVLSKPGELELHLLGASTDGVAAEVLVHFQEVIGYRCLDETDLLEFWPTCALANGWLYEIGAGGWRDLESHRTGFSSRSALFHREFLVTTRDECFSVISKSPPTVSISSVGSSLSNTG